MIKEELKLDRVELLRLFNSLSEEYLNSELMCKASDNEAVLFIDVVPVVKYNRELLAFLLESYELQGFIKVLSRTDDPLATTVAVTDLFLNTFYTGREDEWYFENGKIVEGYMIEEILRSRLYRVLKHLYSGSGYSAFNMLYLFEEYPGEGTCVHAELIKDCFLLAKHGYISFIFNGYLDLPGVCLTDKK